MSIQSKQLTQKEYEFGLKCSSFAQLQMIKEMYSHVSWIKARVGAEMENLMKGACDLIRSRYVFVLCKFMLCKL